MPGENGVPTYRNRYIGCEPGFKASDLVKSEGLGQLFYSRAHWSSRECSRSSQDIQASNWHSLLTGLMSELRRALGLGVGVRWAD
jgi:hypothetical protein